jgi:peptidoglycan-associated lipoprotein
VKSHIIVILALAGFLGACAEQATKPADIEDRSAAEKAAQAAAKKPTAAPAKPAGKAVETKPLEQVATAVTPLEAGGRPGAPAGADPLKDPSSPLSKRSLYFDYDSAVVRDEYRPMLEAHAKYLLGAPSAKIFVQGNTDERGSREYNLALGQRRSESVIQVLSLMGVPASQLEAVSFGEEKPQAQGSSEEAWAQNRRADIHYQGE